MEEVLFGKQNAKKQAVCRIDFGELRTKTHNKEPQREMEIPP